MYKYQRKLNKSPKKNDIQDERGGKMLWTGERCKDIHVKIRSPTKSRNGSADLEEVLSPLCKRKDKTMMNRCCHATPDYRSFGQLINESKHPALSQHDILVAEQYQSIFQDIPFGHLDELSKGVWDSNYRTRANTASQYTTLDGVDQDYDLWQNIDNTDDIGKFIRLGTDEETLTQYHSLAKDFYISEVPRVKKIAEKFTKYKKNNIELRKIEEKVVCVEYEVFNANEQKPIQNMRVYFAIKPIVDEKEEKNTLTVLPTTIENNFKISSTELQKLSKTEVEIIDGKIVENQPYLEDLRKILRRRQNTANKDKTTLNLQNLYEMGKREYLEFDTDYDTNVLSKEGLAEIRNLVLGKSTSSAHGICRRTVKKSSKAAFDLSKEGNVCDGSISRSLVKELLRAEGLE